MNHQTFRVFTNLEDAEAFRRSEGTGGFIFATEGAPEAILFPPEFTPGMVFTHPMTRGKSGALR